MLTTSVYSGYKTFIDYIFLKQHFQKETFIWIRNANYRNIPLSTFEKRNDKIFFSQLEKKFSTDYERQDYLISVLLRNQNEWIGNFQTEDYKQFHLERMSRILALEFHFKQSMFLIYEYLNDENLDNFFYPTKNTKNNLTETKTPVIIQIYSELRLSLETLSLIDYFSNFTGDWKPTNPLYKKRKHLIEKYKYLLPIEKTDQIKLKNFFDGNF